MNQIDYYIREYILFSKNCESFDLFHAQSKMPFQYLRGLPRVGEMSGKAKFSPGRGKVGNFEKIKSENFGHLTHVREFCDVMLWNCQGILS